MNYSTYKVQVNYFVQLPQSFLPDFGLLSDLSRIAWHFQASRNSRKVV